MEEGEQKVCLVEVPLERMEEMLMQVQMQLLEEREDREALAAEVVLGEEVEIANCLTPLLLIQVEMGDTAEREVMEAAAAQGVLEDGLLITLYIQERGVWGDLAVLGEEVEAAEMLVRLLVMQEEMMAVMAEAEVMVEVEGVAEVGRKMESLVAAALAALD